MFYTYLRGLVVLFLWSINGNAHHHNTDKILIKMKIILVAPSPHLVGSSLHGLCDQAKTIYLYVQKNSVNRIFVGGFVCVVLFLSTVKIQAPQPSKYLSTSLKVIALSHHFQVERHQTM